MPGISRMPRDPRLRRTGTLIAPRSRSAMTRAMQLGPLFFGVCALGLVGCASSCPAPAAKAQAPVVSTTRLTSADLAETEFAPLVSKPQRGSAPKATDGDDAVEPKDGRRHASTGGFSGYK
jgi:hypothetical protein